MRQKLALICGLLLVAAACGGGDDPDTTPAGATTDPGAFDDAVFVVSEVVFGADGYVAVTNIGSGPGSLDRHQICQRPSYFAIDDVTVTAGETVYFAAGSSTGLDGQVFEAGSGFGRLTASSGEIGLYSSRSFDSSDDIVSYVEWGSSGHGRSSVAVEAGIWAAGDFVATDDTNTGVVANTSDAPITAASWVAN